MGIEQNICMLDVACALPSCYHRAMKIFRSSFLSVLLGASLITACSPKFDWREVHGTSAPYVVVLPAKPAMFSRPIHFGVIAVIMDMVAAEVGGATFAVGSAELPEGAETGAALAAMKTALVNNIHGTIKSEKSSAGAGNTMSIEVEAVGSRNGSAQPVLMMARFVAQGRRVYQVLALGDEKSLPREATDVFFTSFKLN